jgi:hypothetical protein
LPVRLSIAWTLIAVSVTALPARAADDKASKRRCADAYVAAQRLRKADKLAEARAQLQICADDACPATLTKDCKTWLDDVIANQPSVEISVIGLDGSATDAARIAVDGNAVEVTPTEPLPLDPGKHTFHFEIEGATPIDKSIHVSRGDKGLQVSADFSSQTAKTPETDPTPSAPPESDAGSARPIPVAVWVLGGVGLVGLGSFAYFGSKGKSEENNLADTCAPNCNPDDVDASHSKFLIADISLGVSIAAFAGASYFYFTRPTKERDPAVGFVPLSHGGGAAFVRGTF